MIWVVARHKYGISALVTQTSFYEGLSGVLAKRWLFSQATFARGHSEYLYRTRLELSFWTNSSNKKFAITWGKFQPELKFNSPGQFELIGVEFSTQQNDVKKKNNN